MAAKYIFVVLAVIFLLAASLRLIKDRGRIVPASRTWFMVAFIFGAVSVWLWTGGLN